MKNIFKFLTLIIITTLTYSCTSEKNTKDDSPEGKGTLKFENKTYVFKDDGLTSRYLNGKKEFDFKYQNLIKDEGQIVMKKTLSNKDGEEEETILFENNQTGEYIELSNLNELANNKISFDVTTSNGVVLNNLTFESDELNLATINSTESKYCWQCITIVVGVLVDAIVDLASDNYDSNCNAAIKACDDGVKTITIIDQGWFTPASCTVVCK